MCCCAKARAAECLKFRDSVTTECAVCLSHSKARDSKLVVGAVIHQKTSFQETAASFPAPTFLLSLSGISAFPRCLLNSHSLSLLGLKFCKRSIFFSVVFVLCFSRGFHSVPREKPGELLEGNFFIFFFLYSKTKTSSQEGRVCKSLLWSWSASTAEVCPIGLAWCGSLIWARWALQ